MDSLDLRNATLFIWGEEKICRMGDGKDMLVSFVRETMGQEQGLKSISISCKSCSGQATSYLIPSFMAGQDKDQIPHIITRHIRDSLGLFGAADAGFDPEGARIYCAGKVFVYQVLVPIGHLRALRDAADKLLRC
jgi:hypothetical protein